jgi:hypothetical protein
MGLPVGDFGNDTGGAISDLTCTMQSKSDEKCLPVDENDPVRGREGPGEASGGKSPAVRSTDDDDVSNVIVAVDAGADTSSRNAWHRADGKRTGKAGWREGGDSNDNDVNQMALM